MILWLRAQVLEYALLPVLFHEIPVLDEAVSNGVVYAVSMTLCGGEGLVADEEVEVLHAALGSEVGGRASTASAAPSTARRERRGL